MEEASERSMFRTVCLLLFGLVAVTGCAILALVLSVTSATAAENPGESAPVPPVSVPPLSAPPLSPAALPSPTISAPMISVRAISARAIIDPVIGQLDTRVAGQVEASTAPVRNVGEVILPKTTQVVTESVEKLGGGLAATVSGIIDVLPAVDVAPVLDALVPHAQSATDDAAVASIQSSSASLQLSLSHATPTALATPATTVPEPGTPGHEAPPPATSPGPTGTESGASAGMAATIDEGWSATLAPGRTTTQADSVPGSPTFGFDSTPD
jgi:hypothetical protein